MKTERRASGSFSLPVTRRSTRSKRENGIMAKKKADQAKADQAAKARIVQLERIANDRTQPSAERDAARRQWWEAITRIAWPVLPFRIGYRLEEPPRSEVAQAGDVVWLNVEFQVGVHKEPYSENEYPQIEEEFREFYIPTDEELSAFSSEFPDQDAGNPNWDAVRNTLIEHRYDIRTVNALKAQSVTTILGQLWSKPRSPADWMSILQWLEGKSMTTNTFANRRTSGELMSKPGGKNRSVQLALCCLPREYSDRITPERVAKAIKDGSSNS